MASIAVSTAGSIHVLESLEQMTLPTGAAILAGDTVTLDGTTGFFVKGDADGAGTLSAIYGIATHSCASGENLTAVRRGVLSGWTWSTTAYMTPVLAADTAGEITVTSSESNGGSADVVIGFVGSVHDQLLGSSPTKVLVLDIK